MLFRTIWYSAVVAECPFYAIPVNLYPEHTRMRVESVAAFIKTSKSLKLTKLTGGILRQLSSFI